MRLITSSNQLTVAPPSGFRFVGAFFIVLFGGLSLFYSAGILFLLDWRADVTIWEKTLFAGLPVLFAFALVWWVVGDRATFRFDRSLGVFFDGAIERCRLSDIAAVVVRPDQGESAVFYTVELAMHDGRVLTVRRNLWPMDQYPASAKEKAERLAAFLGVPVREEDS